MYSTLLKTRINRSIFNRKLNLSIKRMLRKQKKSAKYEIPREMNTTLENLTYHLRFGHIKLMHFSQTSH